MVLKLWLIMSTLIMMMTTETALSFLMSRFAQSSRLRPQRLLNSLLDDVSLLVENSIDTLEDISLHLLRNFNTYTVNDEKKRTAVVVGSGWAAHAFLKVVDTNMFNVICISPRPYFVFTPMLASTAVGTVEYRSIVEPIRSSNPLVQFVEAEVTDICLERKMITAKGLSDDERLPDQIHITYDHLIFSPGSQVGDFGIKGVRDNCCFIKEIEDVKRIKKTIFDNFEFASLPSIDSSAIDRLLTFLVVGGGPTGVEFVAELCDFIKDELTTIYPHLQSHVKITLINSGPSVLNAFDTALQAKAVESLRSRGITIQFNTKVTGVEDGQLFVKFNNGSESSMQFGLCVWAAGNAPRPITQLLAAKLDAWSQPLPSPSPSVGTTAARWQQDPDPGEGQRSRQMASVGKSGRLDVDEWLRVVGLANGELQGSVFAMGDCAAAHVISSNRLAAEAVDVSNPSTRSTRPAQSVQSAPVTLGPLLLEKVEAKTRRAREQALAFQQSPVLLPQTAQVAAQEGAYLAHLLNWGYNLSEPIPSLAEDVWRTKPLQAIRVRGAVVAKPFRFLNFGLLAYVGNAQAVAQVQLGEAEFIKSSGEQAFLLWRSVYLVKQVMAVVLNIRNVLLFMLRSVF